MSQPQTQDVSNAEESYALNAKWVQGVGPGFWPTKGSGLTLNLGAGTSFAASTRFSYAGGTLSLTDNATNFIFLDTTASNAPAKNTTGYPATGIPIATVTAASGQITAVQDDRTYFWYQSPTLPAQPYAITFDMGGGRTTPPGTGESLLRHIIPSGLTSVSLASGLSGSAFKNRATPTGSCSITINKNGSSIGSINFASGSSSATFTFSSLQTFSPGDVVELVFGTTDPTVLGIYGTLSATRT